MIWKMLLTLPSSFQTSCRERMAKPHATETTAFRHETAGSRHHAPSWTYGGPHEVTHEVTHLNPMC